MDIITFNDQFNIFYKQFKSIILKDRRQKLDIFDKINCRYKKYDIMIKFINLLYVIFKYFINKF